MSKWIKIIFLVIGILSILLFIDLICIFTINKPIFAIKDKSSNLIYRGIFYDTYICHEYTVPQIKAKGIKFTCSYIDIVEDNKIIYTPTEVENVSTYISDISETGATIIIKDTNSKPYTYEEWYKIEKEIDGNWYEVNTIIDNYGFNEIAYIPDKNGKVKFVIDWKWLYGELPLGSYRILKQVNNQYISIQFAIATTF